MIQPSWPSNQSHEHVYCLHSSARSVHNFRKRVIHLSMLDATSSAAEFATKVCTQFEEKPAVHLPR